MIDPGRSCGHPAGEQGCPSSTREAAHKKPRSSHFSRTLEGWGLLTPGNPTHPAKATPLTGPSRSSLGSRIFYFQTRLITWQEKLDLVRRKQLPFVLQPRASDEWSPVRATSSGDICVSGEATTTLRQGDSGCCAPGCTRATTAKLRPWYSRLVPSNVIFYTLIHMSAVVQWASISTRC